MIHRLMVLLCFIALPGCAALDTAGRSSYRIEPVVVEGQMVCCRVEVESGREIAAVHAELRQTELGPEVVFDARDVRAFEGQAIAADVADAAIETVRETLPDIVSGAVKAALGTRAIEGAGALAPMLRAPPGVP